jgi:hypothetical protein
VKLSRIGISIAVAALAAATFSVSSPSAGGVAAYQNPTWWQKGQAVLNSTSVAPCGTSSGNFSEPPNIDMSNEGGPQSETSIAINPINPSQIVGGSNEIFCLPMRGYFSTQGGKSGSWHGVDLPLPAAISTNGNDFGSDPGVAWDRLGNVFYSYIVVFFNPSFRSITGTEMAVARSSDHGQTWAPTYFNQNIGTGKFNDKPMITVGPDNTVYVAWDNASFNQGKSSNNDVILLSRSTDHGVTFSAPVQVSPSQGGQAGVIGADPFVASDGTLFVAWTDAINPAIRIAASIDRGLSFGATHKVADTRAIFQTLPPAQASRGALIYPACGADSNGRLYCSWTDANAAGFTRLFEAQSDDAGLTWTTRSIDDATVANDQFNQWLAVDPITGNIVLSWYDTRNDPIDTDRVSTEVFFTDSTNRGATFAASRQIATAPTDETVAGADLGNQYGDYEGIAAFNGVARPIWTDRRASIAAVGGLDEEIFTETVKE